MALSRRSLQATGWSCARGVALLLVGLVLLLPSNPALAHRLQLFASADGNQIQGRVYFVGGHAARAVEVHVLDAEGSQVASLSSDDEGRFRAPVPAAADYRVVAKSADGHRAEWPIAAAEFVGRFDDQRHLGGGDAEPTRSAGGERPADDAGRDGAVANRTDGEQSGQLTGSSGSRIDSGASLGALPAGCLPVTAELEPALPVPIEQALQTAIEQAVARQVLPLREALAEAQAQASFRDLLGGLGYIAGLAGLGLWWTRRRQQRQSGADKADG